MVHSFEYRVKEGKQILNKNYSSVQRKKGASPDLKILQETLKTD